MGGIRQMSTSAYRSHSQHQPQLQIPLSQGTTLPPIQQHLSSQYSSPQAYPLQYNHSNNEIMHHTPHPPLPSHHATTVPHSHPPVNTPAYANSGILPAPMTTAVPRYAIPPPSQHSVLDARNPQTFRSKKEVKRRTKTGCMTCRVRRIKCDEERPICRNCMKSKRDCAGYDPIYKENPAPANIKPALKSRDGHGYDQYSTEVALLSPQASNDLSFSKQNWSAQSSDRPGRSIEPHFAYNATLDPALAHGEHARRPFSNTLPPVLHSYRRVVPVNIEDLFSFSNVSPSYQVRDPLASLSSDERRNVDSFYRHHYADALDKFFETAWYTRNGPDHMQQDVEVLGLVSQCMEILLQANVNDPRRDVVETRMVWQLSCMPRTAAANSADSDPGINELLPRLDTIENLLTGQFLPVDRIPRLMEIFPPPPEPDIDGRRWQRAKFWNDIGTLVATRDDSPDAAASQEIDRCFSSMRQILAEQESRDIIYSIAIVRHIGGRMPDYHPSRTLISSTKNAEDDVNRLHLAKEFIEREEHHGLTQVMRKMCGMAIRGWILQKRS